MDEIVIEAALPNMDKVLDFVNGRLGDCPPNVRNHIGIAVDEIFSNIANYAYDPEVGAASVRVAVSDDMITMEFQDGGTAYDPLSKDDPDVSLPAEERSIGGLGIFMVKNIMDVVEYRREGNNNILTIKKRLE